MDHATQVALLQRLFAFYDAGTTQLACAPATNPVASYTAAARYAEERARLFHREPLLVGMSQDLAAPGAYLVHEDSGVPILVCRSRDGVLRAFNALCRHRGAHVASGTGTHGGRFACPYHGWTYDDAGRLIAQPCAEGFTGLAPSDLGLRPLPLAERHGFIFVRATPDLPIDVDAHLGGAEHELAPYGLDRYLRFATHTTTRALNWKAVIDGFLEAYHVPMLHAETLSSAILGAPSAWDGFGRCGRMVAIRRSFLALRSQPVSEWNLLAHAVVLYFIFPNTMLIHQLDHVEMVQAYPGVDADTARIVFSFYTPEPVTTERARRHFDGNWRVLLDTIQQEDFPIGEAMQRGYHAPGVDRVIYGRNEPGVAHFHAVLAAALAS